MTFRSALSAVCLLAAPAYADVLECKLKPNADSGGWVTELYYFEYDAGTGTARVEDAVIHSEEGGPIAATISEDTQKKLVLTWDVTMTNSTGQTTRMLFRAAYFKADGSVIVRAVPSGYVDKFEARGKCKKV